MAEYKINKEKCIGCGICITQCEGGTEWDDDQKAKVADPEKLKACGGESLCPYGAIEEVK